jgi:hypothetical protein
MERIVEWLWDGVERCSREYAIQMILENIQ